MMVWMPVENAEWKAGDPWPPTDASPYDTPEKQAWKPGNFFTLGDDNHPAYDLFRTLVEQGWQWEASGGRHWVHMWKDCYLDGNGYGERRWKSKVTFSLMGQGSFENENEHGSWGIGFEDYDDVWWPVLPALAKFMERGSKQRKDMCQRGLDYMLSQPEKFDQATIDNYISKTGATPTPADDRAQQQGDGA